MTDQDSTKKTSIQDSFESTHKQGSLSPASDDLPEIPFGKGYSQERLDPPKQSSISPQTDASEQGSKGENSVLSQNSLSKNNPEEKNTSGGKNIVVPVISFALGLLVAMLIFRITYAPSHNESEDINETAAAEATEEEQEVIMAENVLPKQENTENKNQAEVEASTQDDIIEIPDKALRASIKSRLGIGDREITAADAVLLETLVHDNNVPTSSAIQDLTGLSSFPNLSALSLRNNDISDLTPLVGLSNLTELALDNNEISDLSPLASLTSLESLSLRQNQIQDIRPLSGLTNLNLLYLTENQISDVSSIEGLTRLEKLSLIENQIIDISPLANLNNLKLKYQKRSLTHLNQNN